MSDFEVAPTGTHQQLCEKTVRIDELERQNEMMRKMLNLTPDQVAANLEMYEAATAASC